MPFVFACVVLADVENDGENGEDVAVEAAVDVDVAAAVDVAVVVVVVLVVGSAVVFDDDDDVDVVAVIVLVGGVLHCAKRIVDSLIADPSNVVCRDSFGTSDRADLSAFQANRWHSRKECLFVSGLNTARLSIGDQKRSGNILSASDVVTCVVQQINARLQSPVLVTVVLISSAFSPGTILGNGTNCQPLSSMLMVLSDVSK